MICDLDFVASRSASMKEYVHGNVHIHVLHTVPYSSSTGHASFERIEENILLYEDHSDIIQHHEY